MEIPSFSPPTKRGKNIFITGASGFLGAHLLAQLLGSTGLQIYCLVRCADVQSGKDKLFKVLSRYSLDSIAQYMMEKDFVTIVPGDLSQPFFGLKEDYFTSLAHQIGTIFHVAARVNHVEPYSKLRFVTRFLCRFIFVDKLMLWARMKQFDLLSWREQIWYMFPLFPYWTHKMKCR